MRTAKQYNADLFILGDASVSKTETIVLNVSTIPPNLGGSDTHKTQAMTCPKPDQSQVMTCSTCYHARKSDGKMGAWVNCGYGKSWEYLSPHRLCQFTPNRYSQKRVDVY